VFDQKGLGWMVSSCDVASFYACEKPVPGLSSSTAAVTQPGGTTTSVQSTSTAPITQTTPALDPCGNGTWENLENRCFNFDSVAKSWSDASASCHNLGGVLVTVFDQKDEDFLYCKLEIRIIYLINFLAKAANIPFFIGLNDQAVIGNWIWDQPAGKTLTVCF
jgi:hypothetical protein